jgi:hypothetical protein
LELSLRGKASARAGKERLLTLDHLDYRTCASRRARKLADTDLMDDLPTTSLCAEPTEKGPDGHGLDSPASLEAIGDCG